VEDESLVREEMMRTFPWENNQMEIVAGVGSGRKALDFLSANNIDLMITDLDMPHMSGIELMKSVREQHPHIQMVVLTCYQDFQYIQEAMRIGAIDYIVKTQVDVNSAQDVLHRIADRIAFEQESKAGGGRSKRVSGSAEEGLLFISRGTNGNAIHLYTLPWIEPDSLLDVDEGSWFFSCMPGEDLKLKVEQFLEEPALRQWVIVQVKGLQDIQTSDLRSLIKKYIGHSFFYCFNRESRLYEVNLATELSPQEERANEGDLQAGEKAWASLAWIHDDGMFASLLQQTKQERPTQALLGHRFYSIFVEWSKMLDTGYQTAALIEHFERLQFWEDWTDWLEQTRTLMRQHLRKRIYSDEMVQSVMRAVEIMNQSIGSEIKQNEIAKRVNVSRSYFSQLFKNVVGKPFSDYLRLLRVNRAQSMLMQTNDPIYAIAEACGFEDEKYFSKMFRDHIGVLPTEYRSQYQTKTSPVQNSSLPLGMQKFVYTEDARA